MLASAMRICEAQFGNLWLYDGGLYRVQAMLGAPPILVEQWSKGPLRFGLKTGLGRVATTKETVHIADITAEKAYAEHDPLRVATADILGARTFLAVPMLKDGELLGAIVIYRREVRPFTDKQIELIRNFAAQAVIAIENTRLLSELRQSLEQQTATADVLSVISSSPGELEPVFQAMLKNATRICEAAIGILFRYEDGAYTAVSLLGVAPAYAEYLNRGPIRAGPTTGLGRVANERQTIQVVDTKAEQIYADREPFRVATAELGGARSLLNVPMLKDGELIGAIGIYRQEVKPFTDEQVALVTNFANQAVIAIENTRLLKELRERTGEVEELNQQLEQRVADQVGEIERMGRLRRFLSPQVADLIVASGTERQLESHRREITALFCDLRGFTGFSESSDPEDVMALLREYHAAIGEIIIKYSGTLERFAGDGVMVVFNDPVPVANPALQAVQMALDMRAAIGALIEKWSRLGHDLGFGIGIAHGFATLGTIGFEGRFDYAAIGTVSNVASRLCDEAKPGQILISPRVLMAVEEAVTAEPVGEFTLKGIRRPMAAHNVLAAVPSKI
jgi:class 3 adenylate cyclase/putative methionine-R-sulfoxide reductase with GAF domain